MPENKLITKIGDLELRNPTLLAAGILGQSGSNLKRVWNSGAGGVITKTTGKTPKKGYPGPNVVKTPSGLLNAMGLPNPGIEEMIEEIEKAQKEGSPVIGSIFGENQEEFKNLAEKMEEANVDAIELNLSCPHAEKLSLIGQNPQTAKKIVENCKNIDTPLWAKLPGNTNIPNLIKVAKAVEEGGANAIVLTNTLPGMAIDVEAEKPILGNEKGGLSGPAIKPVGIRLVYEVFEEVDIPIVGAGGIMTGRDMIEYILAGASAVEIGTGIMEKDFEIFEKVCEEAEQKLEDENITDLIGKAH